MPQADRLRLLPFPLLLLHFLLSPGTIAASAAAAPRDVLLITVDTLRADHLSAYGHPRALSPQVDALAARGALFENAIAASSSTAPSHASIMTSRYPREHSIGTNNGGTRLSGGVTLAEHFRDAGYDTAAFVGNFILQPRIGLDRGFAVYDADLPDRELNRPGFFERRAEATGARAVAWLERPRTQPFLLWVQLQDPHGPYTPPDSFAVDAQPKTGESEPDLPLLPRNSGVNGIPAYQHLDGVARASEYVARYEGEVRYADEWIGRLVAAAEAASGERGLVVLLTNDHGESLGEFGFWFQHGHATTPELARSPFIVVAPGVAPQRRSELVHHVDVMPTLVELAGLEPAAAGSGVSLAPFLREGPGRAVPERTVFCDVGWESGAYRGRSYVRVRGSLDLWSRWASGRSDAPGSPPASLLQLESWQRGADGRWVAEGDPAEWRPTIEQYLLKHEPMVEAPQLDTDDVERLRALGYVEPAAE